VDDGERDRYKYINTYKCEGAGGDGASLAEVLLVLVLLLLLVPLVLVLAGGHHLGGHVSEYPYSPAVGCSSSFLWWWKKWWCFSSDMAVSRSSCLVSCRLLY
jgi:hypothetical protein